MNTYIDWVVTDERLEWRYKEAQTAMEGDQATHGGIDKSEIIAIVPTELITSGAKAQQSESEAQSTRTAAQGPFYELFRVEGKEGEDPQLSGMKVSGLPKEIMDSFLVEKLPAHLLLPPNGDIQDAAKPSDSTATSDLPHQNIHLVVSTASGTGKAQKFAEAVVIPLLEKFPDIKFCVRTTDSAHTVSEITRDVLLPTAKKGIKQLVILMSGDGGMVDVLGGLHSHSTSSPDSAEDASKFQPVTVALMPFGTGNALAHSSGITKDTTHGLSHLFRGKQVDALPTFNVHVSPGSKYVTNEGNDREAVPNNELFGAVVCSWGLHASLVADSDTTEWRKLGVDRFKMVAGELLSPKDGSESHRYHGKVTLHAQDGSEKIIDREEHMYVLLTLVNQLEKGFTISPASKPLEGVLRVVHFGALPPDQVMGVLGKAYQGGKHVDDKAVGYETVNRMRIDFMEPEERWRRICVDGKIIAVEEGGWVEVKSEKMVVASLVHL